MLNAPCKDCNFRHLGCHSDCAKYLEWKQIMEVKKQQDRNEQMNDYLNKKRRRSI